MNDPRGYDGASNLKSYSDSVMGTWSFSNISSSGYDSLNRLSLATQTPVSGPAQSFCWTYDSFGNRTAQGLSNQPFTNAAGATTCQLGSSGTLLANTWANYNANNQFTATNQAPGGPSYDASGDVTFDGLNTYVYDGEGRICAVASTPAPGMTTYTGYLYDAEGTRVAKGSITSMSCDPAVNGFQTINDYVLGPGGEQATEMGMDPVQGMVWQHTNIWAAGNLLGTYDKDGLHFYLDDPLGTRRVQTDFAGVVEQTCVSLPFGDGLSCSGGDLQAPTEHHFTGKERDTESGNDYFGARYYASSMGRMMSPDPHTGTLLHMLNPQRWNMYAYALNNPLLFTDPTGMDAIVVNTTSSAFGLGHVGIVSVHSNGSAEYGEFGPVHNGAPIDKGQVNVTPLATKLSFGQDGKPTQGSMDELRKELATAKKVDSKDIRLLDYKTTDAEATNLDHFMEMADLDSQWNTYFFLGPSCVDFTARGLINAGVTRVKAPFIFGFAPNWIFDWLSSRQDEPQGKGTARILPGFVPVQDQ